MRTQYKSKKRSARAAENGYGSDDGFVVGSDEEGDIPLAKRAKTAAAGRNENTSTKQKKKQARVGAAGSADIDDNGDMFWEISHSRRVTVSEFKGKRMVGVREYYEKDGKRLPGKKGISMTIDQYSKFLAVIPEIEIALRAKGENVVRPVFDKSSDDGDDRDSDDSAVEEQGEGKRGNVSKAQKITNGDGNRKRDSVKKDSKKKNFEATSDEEEVVAQKVVAQRAHDDSTDEE